MRTGTAFCEAFAGHDIPASISGAIVFAHFKQPLQAVLREAHHLLGHVAKEDNGRASLAVSVLQGAGKIIEWVATWQANDGSPPLQVQDLASLFRDDQQFSTRFFYGLTTLSASCRGTERERQAFDLGLTEAQMREWMVAEYLDNRELKTTPADAQAQADKLLGVAQAQVDKLLAICRRHRAKPRGFELQPSGARLVKFLVNPEDEA